MRKSEWMEQFDKENGRLPNELEIQQAYEQGEWQDEVNEEVTHFDTPTENELENKEQQVVEQEEQILEEANNHEKNDFNERLSETVTSATEYGKAFWEWLVSVWKQPLASDSGEYFKNHIISFVIFLLLASFSLVTIVNGVLDSIYRQISPMMGYGYFYGYNSPYYNESIFGIDSIVIIFMALVIIFSISLLSSYAVVKYLYKYPNITAKSYFMWYNRILSPNIILLVISLVAGLLRLYSIVFLVNLLFVLVVCLSVPFALAYFKNKSKLDNFYMYILGNICYALCVGIIYFVIVSLFS